MNVPDTTFWEQEQERRCPHKKGSVEELCYFRGMPFPSGTTRLPLDEVIVHREEMDSGETPAVQPVTTCTPMTVDNPVVMGTPVLPNINFVTRTQVEHTREYVDRT